MSEKPVRLVLYVPPETKRIYQEAANQLKVSVSSIASEILQKTIPALVTMTEAQRLIRDDPQRALALLRKASTQSQLDMLNTVSEFESEVESKSE